jgi:acetolactate synthase-1/2/3 large subunit
MTEMTGGEVVARMLQAEGVEKVFGIIDGTYFGFYSALHRLGIEIVTPRHETSAAHMAGTYARLTGRLGVCMASNGPGVANLLPGLVVEQAEGNRVLAITSARRPGIMYPDRGGAYQCFDQSGVIGKIAKWSEAASSFPRVPELLRKALRKSFEGRPGVVHLDVPENIMNGKFKPVSFPPPHSYRDVELPTPTAGQIARAAKLLVDAGAPIIHAGSGVIHANAFAALARVAELLHAPVTTSWAARGVLPETSPLAIPMPHVKLNHKVRNDADAVLIIGSRLGETDWWGKPPYWRKPSEQKTIQIDLDAEMIGLNKPVDLAIRADARVTLELLAEEIARLQGDDGGSKLASRRSRVAGYASTMRDDRAGWDKALNDYAVPMNPAHVGAVCREVFADDTVLVADGGNATIWAMF